MYSKMKWCPNEIAKRLDCAGGWIEQNEHMDKRSNSYQNNGIRSFNKNRRRKERRSFSMGTLLVGCQASLCKIRLIKPIGASCPGWLYRPASMVGLFPFIYYTNIIRHVNHQYD